MGKNEDQIFLQNFIVILVMLLGMITIFVIISRVVGNSDEAIAKQRAQVLVIETQPVGRVRMNAVAGEGTSTATGATDATAEVAEGDIGQQTYEGLCFSCHGTGLPNIPQVGVAEDWVDRIAQGELLLYERAINGYTGASGMMMPPRGGNPTLSDDAVKAAVDYMIEGSQ